MRWFAPIVCFALALVSASPRAAPFAYVPNEGSASVSVIDTAEDRVTATLSIGKRPRGIAVAPDGKRLYISDQLSGALIVYDLVASKELARVPLGKSPEAVYLSHDGKLLAAAVEENDQVVLVDTATLRYIPRVTRGPRRILGRILTRDDMALRGAARFQARTTA